MCYCCVIQPMTISDKNAFGGAEGVDYMSHPKPNCPSCRHGRQMVDK